MEGAEGGRLVYLFLIKKTLDFLNMLLYPWKFRRKHAFNPRNFGKIVWYHLEIPMSKTKVLGDSTWVLLEHPWIFHFIFYWPFEYLHALSLIPLEIPCPQPHSVRICSEIAHYVEINHFWRTFNFCLTSLETFNVSTS